MLRTARFLHGYLRHPDQRIGVEETEIATASGPVPATIYRPSRVASRMPRWVVLHGMTVRGREHPTLERFVRSVAAGGGEVIVPEISAWRDLRMDPGAADEVIAAAAAHFARSPETAGGEVGLIGFSFGATQALITATRPDVGPLIRAVVGFGGYCDPWRTFRFSFTGEHEWRGVRYRLEPDPYGRWMVAANYLTATPGYAAMGRVAEGVHLLAAEAGRRGVNAADAMYDPMKRELRAGLDTAEREVWDLIAAPAGRPVPPEQIRELADQITTAALARHPSLDPRPSLPALARRTVLAHGYHDQLIPFTETLRLREHLPPQAKAYTSISRLFAHSRGAPPLPLHQVPLEALRYFRLLQRALRG